MTAAADESPEERLARWTSIDAAIGRAAENEQLRLQLAVRDAEIADLRVRLQQLATRLGQAETDLAGGRRQQVRRDPPVVAARAVAGKLYRRARALAGRLRR